MVESRLASFSFGPNWTDARSEFPRGRPGIASGSALLPKRPELMRPKIGAKIELYNGSGVWGYSDGVVTEVTADENVVVRSLHAKAAGRR